MLPHKPHALLGRGDHSAPQQAALTETKALHKQMATEDKCRHMAPCAAKAAQRAHCLPHQLQPAAQISKRWALLTHMGVATKISLKLLTQKRRPLVLHPCGERHTANKPYLPQPTSKGHKGQSTPQAPCTSGALFKRRKSIWLVWLAWRLCIQ